MRLRLHRRGQPLSLEDRSEAEAGTRGTGGARDLELSASRLIIHTLLPSRPPYLILNPRPEPPNPESRRRMEHDDCSDVNAGFPRPRI